MTPGLTGSNPVFTESRTGSDGLHPPSVVALFSIIGGQSGGRAAAARNDPGNACGRRSRNGATGRASGTGTRAGTFKPRAPDVSPGNPAGSRFTVAAGAAGVGEAALAVVVELPGVATVVQRHLDDAVRRGVQHLAGWNFGPRRLKPGAAGTHD